LADRFGRRKTMIENTLLIIAYALIFPSMLGSGNQAMIMAFLLCVLSMMWLSFGTMGDLLPDLFPTVVSYTWASLSYYLSSFLG
ncbi:MFS transporter, partial [Erwinia amylovora]|nr:MFS transporter [Erwinia amylovora]